MFYHSGIGRYGRNLYRELLKGTLKNGLFVQYLRYAQNLILGI